MTVPKTSQLFLTPKEKQAISDELDFVPFLKEETIQKIIDLTQQYLHERNLIRKYARFLQDVQIEDRSDREPLKVTDELEFEQLVLLDYPLFEEDRGETLFIHLGAGIFFDGKGFIDQATLIDMAASIGVYVYPVKLVS